MTRKNRGRNYNKEGKPTGSVTPRIADNQRPVVKPTPPTGYSKPQVPCTYSGYSLAKIESQAKQDSYASMARSVTVSAMNSPMCSIFYVHCHVPLIILGTITNICSTIKINDALRYAQANKDKIWFWNLLPKFREALNLKGTLEVPHEHDDMSIMNFDGNSVCMICAPYVLNDFIIKNVSVEDSDCVPMPKVAISSNDLASIGYGMLQYLALSGSVYLNTALNYDGMDQAFNPTFVTNATLTYKLAHRLSDKFSYVKETLMFKSKLTMSESDSIRLIMLYQLTFVWDYYASSVKNIVVTVHERSIFPIPPSRFPTRKVSKPYTYFEYDMSPEATAYYRESIGKIDKIPVLRLYIDGITIIGMNDVYPKILRYMQIYYALVLERHPCTGGQVIGVDKLADNFLTFGSLRTLAQNNGVLFTEVLPSFNPRSNTWTPYDRYMSFDPPYCGAFNHRAVGLLMNVDLIHVLNHFMIRHLQTEVAKEQVVDFYWCFEYGTKMIVMKVPGLTVTPHATPSFAPVMRVLFELDEAESASWGYAMFPEDYAPVEPKGGAVEPTAVQTAEPTAEESATPLPPTKEQICASNTARLRELIHEVEHFDRPIPNRLDHAVAKLYVTEECRASASNNVSSNRHMTANGRNKDKNKDPKDLHFPALGN